MCGRFHFTQEIRHLFTAAGLEALSVKDTADESRDICPGDRTMVLASSRNREIRAYSMSWGYHLPDGKLVFNARSESASSKAMFSDGIAQRRCLVPADRYYEWEKTADGKRKYRLAPVDSAGFFLAGIYRLEGKLPVFTILTRAPSEEISFIHDRMPVIIPPPLCKDWLDPSIHGDLLLATITTNMSFQPESEIKENS